MFLYNLRGLFDNPPALIAYLAAFLVAYVTGIAFHEFCHAWAANELGDNTAARQGRLTLNPVAHVDPAGLIMLFLVGFGWGRPTPVNPYRLRNGVKRGNMLVALAGPLSNLFFAVIAAIPLRTGMVASVASFDDIANASGSEIIGLFLVFIVFYNVLLGCFNLIPIPPLDGFKVAVGILPDEASRGLARLEPYGMGILMTLFVIGFVAPQYNILGWFITNMSNQVFRLIGL
ncbi:MAG: site-2 protease family protein [Dehalococcoidia bacterium]|nr:site-2 protease family protein [Dehalococcoidia bacterium]